MKNKPVPNFYRAFQAICFLALTMLSSSNGYAQVNGEKELKLTANYLAASTTFKSLIGNDRKSSFKILESLIKPNVSTAKVGLNNTSDQFIITEKDLLQVFGQPDLKISNSIYQYNLGISSSNCKAVIGLSKDGIITFYTQKDCQ